MLGPVTWLLFPGAMEAPAAEAESACGMVLVRLGSGPD